MKKGDIVYLLEGYVLPHFTTVRIAEEKGYKRFDRPQVEIISIHKDRAHIRYLKNAYASEWVDIDKLSSQSDIKE